MSFLFDIEHILYCGGLVRVPYLHPDYSVCRGVAVEVPLHEEIPVGSIEEVADMILSSAHRGVYCNLTARTRVVETDAGPVAHIEFRVFT